MSTILTAADAFVLATADDEMQDRWIPDEEWVRHIRVGPNNQLTHRRSVVGQLI
jgi:hypothetical protein